MADGVNGDCLAQWEAKHRTEAEAAADRERDEQGRFVHPSVTLTPGEPRDQESARGIRRRLVKRAQAGDTQAAALVEQLKAGLPVNQAAIAAGMTCWPRSARYNKAPDRGQGLSYKSRGFHRQLVMHAQAGDSQSAEIVRGNKKG